jgi:hypothetical protein
VIPQHGLAYYPDSNAWSTLPKAPLTGRNGPTGVWTGSALFLWGGSNPKRPLGNGNVAYADGATFMPEGCGG